MSPGNGGEIPHIGERGALLVSATPSAEDCAKNFLQGKPPEVIVAAALIGILGQLELAGEREANRIAREATAEGERQRQAARTPRRESET